MTHTAESISPQPGTSSVLPPVTPDTWLRDRHIFPSPWVLNIHPSWYTSVYPSFDLSAACASRRTYASSQSPVVSSIDFPVAQYGYPGYTTIVFRTQIPTWVLFYTRPTGTTAWVFRLSMAGIFWVFSTNLASQTSSIGVDSSSCCPA